MDLFKVKYKTIKILIVILIIGFVGIQFFPTNLNQSSTIPKEDIIVFYKAPQEVAFLLKNYCYDCHSNNTTYEWFNTLKPVYWLMENHIIEGKKELNFNEFAKYSKRRQKSKLKSLISQIKDDEMPLSSYTFIHKEAKLSVNEKEQILFWMNKLRDSL